MYYGGYAIKEKRAKRGRIIETVECLNKGMNVEQIAEELGVTQRTVQKYIKYIRENQ